MSEWKLQGQAADFWLCRDREVLNAGPARCGKTHVELVKTHYLAQTYPGSRHLWARETRKSLSETILPDFENKILGRGHPLIGRARRSHRDGYHYPNGSDIILLGLDDVTNVLSAELDSVTVYQAEQIPRQDTWDALLSRLSGRAMPYVQAVLDVNPAGENHWIIRRAAEILCLKCSSLVERGRTTCKTCGSTQLGGMRHFAWKHTSNPLLYDAERGEWTLFGQEYLVQVLGRLRGVRRKRLLDGLWVSEEGQVLEEWDPDIHRISGKLERTAFGWTLLVNAPGWSIGSKDPMREARVHLDWFGAGADYGFSPDPGVIEVFGYDRHGRRFRVAEVYQTRRHLDWWAGVADELHREFDLRYIAVDPSSPAMRDALNMRISGRGGAAIAIPADNTIRQQKPDLAGIDLMRWGLKDQNGMVRTFFVRDAQRHGIDMELRDAGRPTSLEDEIPEWVLARKKSTDETMPKPDEECDDHGLDAARYEGNEGWGHRHAATIGASTQYPEGSAGSVHRHAEKLAAARAWSAEHS